MTTPAHKLIIQGRVILEAEAREGTKLFWAVGKGKNKVSVIQTKGRLGSTYKCTCKLHSIHGPMAGLCVFIKAVVAYEVLGVKK